MNPIYGQSVTTGVEYGSGYPVAVEFREQRESNRFWAIPVVGYYAKLIILIPHIIVLGLLGLVTMLAQLVLWIPVLTTGRYPESGYTLTSGLLRWSTRVQAFFFGLNDKYPAFSMEEAPSGEDTVVRIRPPQQCNRFWAVPIVGLAAKLVILIPHLIVLYVLGLVSALLSLITWIPVLFGGRYPDWGYTIQGGYIRYYMRVYAFIFGLTDIYPPFQLNS